MPVRRELPSSVQLAAYLQPYRPTSFVQTVVAVVPLRSENSLIVCEEEYR